MLYDIAHFWLALLAAIVLGAACARFTRLDPPARRPVARSRATGATLLFLAGLVMAFAAVLPGRAGLWLETALLLIVAYSLGWLTFAPWVQETQIARPVRDGRKKLEAQPSRETQSRFLIILIATFAATFALLMRIFRNRRDI